jgi:hypothetical protein
VMSILLSTDLPDSLAPMRLTVPAAIASTEVPIAMLFDRASGTILPLPAVRISPTQVATVARHLNGSRLDGTATLTPRVGKDGGVSLRTSGMSTAIQLVIGAIDYTDLTRDITTGYTPGTDDWEFDNMLTAFGPSSASARALGLAVSSAWYFDKFKTPRGSLNGRYQEAVGVEFSNPRGVALAKVVGVFGSFRVGAQLYNQALSQLVEIVRLAEPTTSLTVDSLTLLAVKAGMFATGKPYVLVAMDSASSDPDATAASMVVYASRGNTLSVTSGTSAPGLNAPRSLALASRRFGSVTVGRKDPESGTAVSRTLPHILATGFSSGIAADVLNRLWASFFANNINTLLTDSSTFTIATRDYRPVRDTLFVPNDSAQLWIECTTSPGCPSSYTVTGGFTPVGNVASGGLYTRRGGAWTVTNTAIRGRGLWARDAEDGLTVGLSLLARVSDTQASYGGWRQFVIKTKRLTITPSSLTPTNGMNFTMTATYDRPVPPSASYVWELGDGRSITTTTNTLTTKYDSVFAAPRAYRVKVSLRTTTALEATGRITATVNPALFGWRMRTASVTASTLPPGGIGTLRSDTLAFNFATAAIARLTGAPTSSALFLSGVAVSGTGCSAGIVLQQAPSGVIADTIVSNQFVGILGVCGDEDYSGSLVMGTLGSGTIVGSAAALPSETVIVAPGGSINSTMAGRVLSGSFVWNVRYSTGLATYSVNFTADQIRPQ